MSKKILVTYASRTGTTAETAEAVAKTLAECGVEVELLPMQQVQALEQYRAVVAGSAVRGQRWLPEAMQFLREHRAALAARPFAAFTVCITLAMPGAEKYRPGVLEWLAPVRALVRPLSEGLFPGKLDFDKLPLNFDTLKLRATVAAGVFPRGDHRDWQAVRTWAESLPPLLLH